MLFDRRILFLDLRARLSSWTLRAGAFLLSAVLVGGFVVVAWERLRGVRHSFRTSSSPGAGAYEVLAGPLMGGVYRDIALEALAAVGAIPEPEVLEVGHGPGHLGELLLAGHERLRWSGLDVDPDMVAAARVRAERAGLADRARFEVGDVAAMPFDDASFDLVVSSFSAHHWPDAAAGFREIRRVLRPGGTALVFDLPASWGHAETGSKGIAAADAAFTGVRRDRLRGIGPLTIVWRVTLRT
jgi:SAM-dependent methyltransferase